MQEFKDSYYHKKPITNFTVGDKVYVKTNSFTLFFTAKAIIKNILPNNKYEVIYDNPLTYYNNIVNKNDVTSCELSYVIHISPFKYLHDDNSIIFHMHFTFDSGIIDSNYYFFIIYNCYNNEWCFIQNDEYTNQVHDELKNNSTLDSNCEYLHKFLNQYFQKITQFKIQDQNILDKIIPINQY